MIKRVTPMNDKLTSGAIQGAIFPHDQHNAPIQVVCSLEVREWAQHIPLRGFFIAQKGQPPLSAGCYRLWLENGREKTIRIDDLPPARPGCRQMGSFEVVDD